MPNHSHFLMTMVKFFLCPEYLFSVIIDLRVEFHKNLIDRQKQKKQMNIKNKKKIQINPIKLDFRKSLQNSSCLPKRASLFMFRKSYHPLDSLWISNYSCNEFSSLHKCKNTNHLIHLFLSL